MTPLFEFRFALTVAVFMPDIVRDVLARHRVSCSAELDAPLYFVVVLELAGARR